MFRLECCARTARRNPSVHIRIAESICRSPGYGRIWIAASRTVRAAAGSDQRTRPPTGPRTGAPARPSIGGSAGGGTARRRPDGDDERRCRCDRAAICGGAARRGCGGRQRCRESVADGPCRCAVLRKLVSRPRPLAARASATGGRAAGVRALSLNGGYDIARRKSAARRVSASERRRRRTAGRSAPSSARDAPARYRRHPAASFVNSLSVPTPRRLLRATGHPAPVAPTSPMLAVFWLTCHQNFRAANHPPSPTLEANMAKAGTAASSRSDGGRPTTHWSRQIRTNSKARHRFSAFSHGSAPDRSRSPPKGCPD